MAKSVSFSLELTPPTINHYWNHKGARRFMSDRAIEFRRIIKDKCLDERLEGFLAIRIEYYPPDKRKRDIDNILKPILDALQHAQLFADDYQIQKITALRKTKIVDGGLVLIKVSEYED
jgi:crossover junction endodeoxyribonuclease RusA